MTVPSMMARVRARCALGLVPKLFAAVLAVSAVTALAARAPANQGSPADGEQLFRSYCAACHGEDGRGQGPAGPALKTRPADLTTIARRHGGKFPRERLVRYVVDGEPSITAHGSKEMPIWGPNLTALGVGAGDAANEQVGAIVTYLESIQRGR
jgi:mono/diheme cytochrome c family protein